MQIVDKVFSKIYTLGAMFTLGALWFTMAGAETVYTGWEIFIVSVLGGVGWPIVWGATVVNIINTYVGG